MLHGSGSASTLALMRIAVCALWLVDVARWDPSGYGRLPDDLFAWPSVLRKLVPESTTRWLLTGVVLTTLRDALVVGLVWTSLRLPPHGVVALLTCLMVALYEQIRAGFGYIDPSRILPFYALLAVTLLPARASRSCGERMPPDRQLQQSRYTIPLLAVSAAFTLCYAFVGVRRLCQTAAQVFFTDSLSHWMVLWSAQLPGPEYDLANLVAGCPRLKALANLFFFLVTIFEVLSPLALVNRAFRRLWLVVITSFQIVAYHGMHILFWENLILMWLFFSDVDGALARWRRPTTGEDRVPVASVG